MSLATIKSDAEIQKDVMKELDWDPQVDAVEVGIIINLYAACSTRTMLVQLVPNQGRPRQSRVLGFLMPPSDPHLYNGSCPVGFVPKRHSQWRIG